MRQKENTVNRRMIQLSHNLFALPIEVFRTPLFLRFWIRKPHVGQHYGAYDLAEQRPHEADLLIAGLRMDHKATPNFVPYMVYPDQPAQDIMRITENWKKWCLIKQQIVNLARDINTVFEKPAG